jgi:thiol-disulfide isomerase/thioredoxin
MNNIRNIIRVTALLAWLIGPVAGAAEPEPVLHLTNGGFVPGALGDSDRLGVLSWRGSSFVEPFDFDLDAVESVRFPAAAAAGEQDRAPAEFCFELTGGDVLTGTLVALDERTAVVETLDVGRLHIRRSQIHRISRRDDRAGLVYLGPQGLSDWQPAAPPGSWRQEQGRLSTAHPKATLRGDFRLPAQAVVEFEIAWQKKPDFLLALGVGNGAAEQEQEACRFEVWESIVVALRETKEDLALAPVGKALPGAGRLHLRAYLDQIEGRVIVTSPADVVLADLKRPAAAPQALTGIALTNLHGDVRLERLRVSRWNGAPPQAAPARLASLERVDGSTLTGEVASLDPDSHALVVRDGTSETRVLLSEVASLLLSHPREEPGRGLGVVTQDGVRLSGELIQVKEGAVWLSVPGVQKFARVPIARLRSLVVLRHEQVPRDTARSGVLELEGVRLPGLLSAREGPLAEGSSCLAWQPLSSATASHLRMGVSGKIIVKEPQPEPNATRPGGATARVAVRQPNGAMILQPVQVGGLVVGTNRAVPPAQPVWTGPMIHLRTGDAIPASVTKIDANGVWFESRIAQTTFVPHARVQAIELAPEMRGAARLTRAKRERLLTVPRIQRDAPPTHLIASRDGDYLRGRIVDMVGVTLHVEVQLETRDVPRDRIARIIWLHSDEPPAAGEPPKPVTPESGLRVQAVQQGGNRLTFVAQQMAGSALVGRSDTLGDCRVGLGDVEKLLIGAAIEQANTELAHQQWNQWRLQNAPEPRVAQGDDAAGAGGRAPGTEAALVGKPAPEFELELLGAAGAKFRLAEARGQVLVLDFWATWCGPCMQAMPQVERVVDQFRDRGVALLAVNLQENPQQITAALERHKLHPSVALDRDGRVAEKYGAHAIPQTVVIDPGGTVTRIFVGGGPHLAEQLREALEAALK